MSRKKKSDLKSNQEKKSTEARFKVVNKTLNAFPLMINRDGKQTFIDVRRQGKGRGPAPVILKSEITDYATKLVKRGFISLERI